MKFLKKLIPIFVIFTILLSLVIIPSSASYDTDTTIGTWYYLDALPASGFRVEGVFKLPSYDFFGSSYLYDYSSYRTYNVLSFSNGIFTASNANGSVSLSSGAGIFPYNQFLFIESLKDSYDHSNQNAFFSWIDDLTVCDIFYLDSLVIPFVPSDTFGEMLGYIPNVVTVGGRLSFEFPFDNGVYPIFSGGSTVYIEDSPSDFDFYFSTSDQSDFSILSGFGFVSSWITSSLGSLDEIFFNEGALTPLGIFCLIALAIAIAFLIFNVVNNFLKMRS